MGLAAQRFVLRSLQKLHSNSMLANYRELIMPSCRNALAILCQTMAEGDTFCLMGKIDGAPFCRVQFGHHADCLAVSFKILPLS